jgi:hypothetical protein
MSIIAFILMLALCVYSCVLQTRLDRLLDEGIEDDGDKA